MRPGKRVLPGRHALFSGGDPGTAPSVAPKKNGTARAPLAGMTRPPLSARPARLQKSTVKSGRSTKSATSSRAAKSAKTVKAVRAVTVDTTPLEDRRSGPIGLSCSKCGTHSDVAIVKYLLLHLPYWVWRPGRGYTSLMKCPACGKRTWVSASWGPGQD